MIERTPILNAITHTVLGLGVLVMCFPLLIVFVAATLPYEQVIDVPMTLIATIGLFGYVFSKRIYKQSFWICFFGVYLSYSLVSLFLSEIEFSTPDDPELSAAENKFLNTFSMILSFVLVIPLVLPAYIGLLLYALPSNKLWKNIN